MDKKINVGGQAVIEGVMIRGLGKYVIAVRKKSKIVSKWGKIRKKSALYRLPLIRGFVNLAEMLAIGIKALMWSAEQAAPKEEKIGKNEFAISFLISIGAVILIFIALPYFLANLAGFHEEKNPVLFNIVDGIIRISFFLAYIVAISFMKDVKILFQYHGAEHKAIHCYESGKKLNISNIKKFSTLHPRCGTAFIMIVMVVAILTFSVITPILLFLFPSLAAMHVFPRKAILFLARIAFIPLIAGLSYEFLKFSARYEKNPMMKIMIFPGLLMQKITTKEPNPKQIEVAMAAVNKAIKSEK